MINLKHGLFSVCVCHAASLLLQLQPEITDTLITDISLEFEEIRCQMKSVTYLKNLTPYQSF